MAEVDNPFASGPMPSNDTFRQLQSEWSNFLEQPGARTALLQAGISMLQPPSFGDTPMSQFGRAVGSAGEAVTRQGVLEQRERESDAKTDLAEARADAASARAGAAGAGAGLAEQRLGIQRERLGMDRERYGLQDQMKEVLAYQSYVQKAQTINSKAMEKYEGDLRMGIIPKTAPPPTQIPILPMEEWAVGMGLKPGVAKPTPAPGTPGVGGTASPVPGAKRPTATNPKTGEQVEWDGSKWVPIR